MILLLISCVMHKTDLSGVVDHVSYSKCTVELNTGEVIVIESQVCKNLKEGDIINFYGRRK